MTRTFNISGSGNVFRNILRPLFVVAATIGGLFMLIASAAFAFFVVAGIVLIGALVFTFFWGRAKLFGRPFGPQAHFEKARAQMEAQMRRQNGEDDMSAGGPVIDARQTPQGWSVDD